MFNTCIIHNIYIYILYIYIYAHTHTHTHTYIYICCNDRKSDTVMKRLEIIDNLITERNISNNY